MSSKLFKILRLLDEARIHYFIERYRDDTVDIVATVVGKRIEISVFEDDHAEISVFTGNEDVLDEAVLYDLLDEERQANERHSKQ